VVEVNTSAPAATRPQVLQIVCEPITTSGVTCAAGSSAAVASTAGFARARPRLMGHPGQLTAPTMAASGCVNSARPSWCHGA